MLEAKRTLVKSAPELWSEVSDPGALARHLAPFGSVRITRAQQDSLVAWEGERACGSVQLESTGFGTRVTLMAETGSDPEPEPAVEPEPEPANARPGLWARFFRRGPAEPAALGPPPAPAPAPAVPAAPAIPDATAMVVLTDMLDALGRAHHRPFSRA